MSATLTPEDLDDPLGTEPIADPQVPPETPAAPDGWKVDSKGREYIPKPQGRGMIYRLDGESPAEALARDALPKDRRPKRKTKVPKKQPAPQKVDLKELERTIAEALKTPALIAAAAGDQWAADHFTNTGPYLARNLITASEHNPWLRQKLEEAATGGDAMMKIVTLMPLAGGIFLYFVPPIVYWLNLPVPNTTRARFGIPDRKEKPAEYAAPAESPGPTIHAV